MVLAGLSMELISPPPGRGRWQLPEFFRSVVEELRLHSCLEQAGSCWWGDLSLHPHPTMKLNKIVLGRAGYNGALPFQPLSTRPIGKLTLHLHLAS